MDSLKLEIRELIVAALDLEDIRPQDINDEQPLFGPDGLGLDSIDALELGVALRKKYALQLDANNADTRQHFRTVSTLAEMVRLHQGAQAVRP